MELENYFDFVEKDVIRIKGNRIDIEIVLEDYLEGASPEEILLRYPTLNLEKIHATILYYLSVFSLSYLMKKRIPVMLTPFQNWVSVYFLSYSKQVSYRSFV